MTDAESTFDRSPLLDDLRADIAVDDAALERVRKRVTTTLTAAHLAALGQAASVVPQPALPQRWLRATWAGLAAALAVGTALGAGGHALVSSLIEPTPHTPARALDTKQRPLTKQKSVIAPSAAPQPELPAEAVPPVETSPSVRRYTPPLPESAGLDAELRQLEEARGALSTGHFSRALALLAAHAQDHPRSMLAQEREALKVKTLVAAGRYAEARAAGERFAASYPQGLLLDTVKASLRTIP
jgi:hypothetical protein